MKKILILVICLIIGGGIFVLVTKNQKSGDKITNNQTAQVDQVQEQAKIEDRPFVTLMPRSDGKELTLTIDRLKSTEKVEYELVYLSNDLSRGVVGSVAADSGSITRKLLLGSCSKNVCKYDENVTGGTLTIRLRGTDGTVKYSSDFVLQKGGKEMTSKNNDFSFSGSFGASYCVLMDTIGLPADMGKNISSEPWGVFCSGLSAVSNGVVKINLPDGSASPKLYSYDGKGWQVEENNFEASNGAISASVKKLTTFVLAE